MFRTLKAQEQEKLKETPMLKHLVVAAQAPRMLRQIWRQRGAYNVVNLPFAASQDDPGSSTGRADRSADWRRHYNPALEPEFREDVGCKTLPPAQAAGIALILDVKR